MKFSPAQLYIADEPGLVYKELTKIKLVEPGEARTSDHRRAGISENL
jgi:hypothetical protein